MLYGFKYVLFTLNVIENTHKGFWICYLCINEVFFVSVFANTHLKFWEDLLSHELWKGLCVTRTHWNKTQ